MTSIPRRTVLLGATVAVAAGATPAMARASTAVRPLDQAHAHNDYEHDRPLLNALDNGFTSVEADVWLVGDELYVGHDGPDLTRTLRSLYLDPLRRRIRGNRQRVFRDRDAPIRLLVDVKSPEPAAYDVINKQLSAYPELITVWRNGRRFDRAVTVVLSGAQANKVVPERDRRWFGFDGRIGNLPAGANAEQIPLVSENWTKFFTWQGVGAMPTAERERLHQMVSTLHADDHQVRFWATPDREPGPRNAVWTELLAAGVNVLNTDDLAALRDFLLTHT